MPYNLTNSSSIKFFKTPLLLVFFWGVFGVSTSFSQDYRAEFDSVVKRGRNAFFTKDSVVLNRAIDRLAQLYALRNDSLVLAKYFHFRALYNKNIYRQDSAMYYYQKSADVSIAISDSLEVGRRLLSMANLQREVQDYIGSEANSILGLKFIENRSDKRFVVSLYTNLGLIAMEQSMFNKSLGYFHKARLMCENVRDVRRGGRDELRLINNIGLVYQRKGNQIRALQFFEEGLRSQSLETDHPLIYALLIENFAASSYLNGERRGILSMYKEVLDIRMIHKDFFECSTSHINFTVFYKAIGDTKKALKHAKQALFYAKKSHNNRRWLEALEELSDLTSGETSKAYMRQYIHLNDSLIKNERTVKNQFARIRYETQKKEEENQQLLATNKANKEEIRFQKQQKLFGWLFAALSLLGLIIGGLLVVLRRKELLHKAQLQKERARFEERDRIAKELHDGIVGRLFGARFGLGMVQLQEAPEGVSEVYQQYLNELQQIEKDIRDVSHRLQQELPKDEDFITGLKRSMELQCEAVSLEYQITTDPQIRWELIETTVLWHVLRVVQEAVQNVIKHANATEVRIEFQQQKEMLTLKISDNGRGFDPVTASEGIGLRNIKSRLTEIGGELTITSKSGEGTSLLIFLAT
ncbi:conserved hypothetical protein [Tenacibaculum litopenaei]|uniref:ATP-binding protein n=1 Tax=Tenacibaculum litopenaei TaxID=396016 RepID=UPI003896365F